MPILIVSGAAQAFAHHPRASDPLTDNEALARIHGAYSAEVCSETLDESLLQETGISGGRLRFEHNPEESTLRIKTSYDVPRDLNSEERTQLVEATLAQWSDGIGSGSFRNHGGEILSTTLAMAIQNTDPTRTGLGDLFVDAYPLVDDRDVRVTFHEKGSADDVLVKDLISAAESGAASALVELGQRYGAGDGVEQDDKAAFDLYTRAAAAGHPMGLTLLGECLLCGYGAAKDQARAVECFRSAAASDLPLAMHYLGECYTEGYGVKANLEEAVHWYRRGADLGDPGCLAELGDCLEFGNGVEKDLKEALRCYRQSLAAGFDVVLEAIERIELALRPHP